MVFKQFGILLYLLYSIIRVVRTNNTIYGPAYLCTGCTQKCACIVRLDTFHIVY